MVHWSPFLWALLAAHMSTHKYFTEHSKWTVAYSDRFYCRAVVKCERKCVCDWHANTHYVNGQRGRERDRDRECMLNQDQFQQGIYYKLFILLKTTTKIQINIAMVCFLSVGLKTNRNKIPILSHFHCQKHTETLRHQQTKWINSR